MSESACCSAEIVVDVDALGSTYGTCVACLMEVDPETGAVEGGF